MRSVTVVPLRVSVLISDRAFPVAALRLRNSLSSSVCRFIAVIGCIQAHRALETASKKLCPICCNFGNCCPIVIIFPHVRRQLSAPKHTIKSATHHVLIFPLHYLTATIDDIDVAGTLFEWKKCKPFISFMRNQCLYFVLPSSCTLSQSIPEISKKVIGLWLGSAC